MNENPFDQQPFVTHYAEGPPRMVPGFAGLQRMTWLLLKERAPAQANILVLGAGGGLELKFLAEAEPDWKFEGIDPSQPMLDLAAQTLGPLAERVTLTPGRVESAAPGPFHGATCLLTFHFIPLEERRHTLQQLRRRLLTGAPLVVAHLSVPEPNRQQWISRYLAFSGAPDSHETRTRLETQLTILTPDQDEALLREAGFLDVHLFYTGFTFRGWVASA
ncbi:MAG: class I SAM-dependent methyltransferase [Candidatus Eremiobacteraeota bacterium]|nr:class I SAM-dependent methyltransferase [Candidatus Eremiobacteraeota bacterium]